MRSINEGSSFKMRIKASLLREKFVIRNLSGTTEETDACSNRMVLNLHRDGLQQETFVVRTDSMHLCARMAGRILSNYENHGPFAQRLPYIEWLPLWDSILSGYEHSYNTRRWVAIYHDGALIYEYGSHHPFLDIIEQFENKEIEKDTEGYCASLKKAENAFRQAGKTVEIDYNGNVALVISLEPKSGRCSVILRSPEKTTTFHYALKPGENVTKITASHALLSAGDFMEGINLCYFIGMNNAFFAQGGVSKLNKKDETLKKTSSALHRLDEINIALNLLEDRYIVHYRPERPRFDLIIAQTERYAKSCLQENISENA